MVYTCGTCWKEFPAGWNARDQHCDALGHDAPNFECDECDEYFDNDNQKQYHMRNYCYADDDDFECGVCDLRFSDEEKCEDHEIDVHFYCSDCERFFKDLMSIDQHLDSSIHSGAAQQPVQQQYANAVNQQPKQNAPSKNPPQLDRTSMHQVVRHLDPKGVICKTNVQVTKPVVYQATQRAWNSNWGQYECYLCHNGFNTLEGLNQHLNSSRHQEAIYNCPNSACERDFTTLAALIAHLESGSCHFVRFQEALGGMQQAMRSLKL